MKKKLKIVPTEKEIRTLLLLLESGKSATSIAKVLNRTVKEVRYLIDHLDDYKKQNSALYEVITEFRSKELLREATLAEKVADLLKPSLKYLEYVDPKKAVSLPQPRVRKKALKQQAVLLISDTHVGKVTPTYNIGVFKERLDNLIKNVLEVSLLEQKSYNIEVLNIFMLGDIIDGNRIYKNQTSHIETNVYDQVMIAVGAFAEAFVSLLPYFKKLRIYCVKGNHGRVSFEEHEKVNWDMFVYKMLELTLKKYIQHGDIFFKIADTEDYTMRVDIDGTSFLLSHGEEIKQYLSVPYYGLIRDTASLTGMYKDTFDSITIGHFHTSDMLFWNNKFIFMNGTFVTDDLFGKKVIKRLPSNRFHFFGVNPKHNGEFTFHYLISLTRRSYKKS